MNFKGVLTILSLAGSLALASSEVPKSSLLGTVPIGQSCAVATDCVDTALSNCVNSICTCITDYVPSHENNFMNCIPIVKDIENDVCAEDVQCQQGTPGYYSQCQIQNHRCRCNPEAVPFENECYRLADQLGDQCQKNVQCDPISATCLHNICVCPATHIEKPDRSKCLWRRDGVGGGNDCESDVQCTLPDSVCTISPGFNNVCQCKPGFGTTPNNDECYKYAEFVNEPCNDGINHQDQCKNVEGSRCLAEKCACDGDATPSSDYRKCLPRGSLNSPCTEHVQCAGIGNSICNATTVGGPTCQCVNGYVNLGDNQNCVKILTDINTRCDHTVQCSAGLGEFAECIQNYCLCRHHSEHYAGHCYVPAKLGEICQKGVEQCYLGVNKYVHCGLVNGSSTIRTCQCLPDAQEFEEKCYIQKKLGDECETTTECTFSIKGNRVHCDGASKKCVCNQGYTEDESKMLCNTGSSLIFQSFYSCIALLIVTLVFNHGSRYV